MEVEGMQRRHLLMCAGSALTLRLLGRPAGAASYEAVSYTDEEWRARLTREQYAVLRLHETEQPYSSRLTDEKRRGMYACGGCGLSVFSSADKYNSRTGWPSFVRPLVRAIREKSDRSQGLRRTTVECRRCSCHLGHVFGDGPPPTRLRYCINGAGLTFIPT
jgi:peptide-methionine (R)-S-oxide reductase